MPTTRFQSLKDDVVNLQTIAKEAHLSTLSTGMFFYYYFVFYMTTYNILIFFSFLEDGQGMQVQTVSGEGRGRPALDISTELLQMMSQARFTAVRMARTLKVSVKTVHRRLRY